MGGDVSNIDAIDANNIFEDRGALVRGLPVEEDPVCLDAGEGNEGRDGDFEA